MHELDWFYYPVDGYGKQKKRMIKYSHRPLALRSLCQKPSICRCFLQCVFNCYSGIEFAGSILHVPAGKVEGSCPWPGVWGIPLCDLTVWGCHTLHPLMPGTLPALLSFIASDITWHVSVFIGHLSSSHEKVSSLGAGIWSSPSNAASLEPTTGSRTEQTDAQQVFGEWMNE